MVVLLPAPLGPRKATTSPVSNCKGDVSHGRENAVKLGEADRLDHWTSFFGIRHVSHPKKYELRNTIRECDSQTLQPLRSKFHLRIRFVIGSVEQPSKAIRRIRDYPQVGPRYRGNVLRQRGWTRNRQVCGTNLGWKDAGCKTGAGRKVTVKSSNSRHF